MPKVVVIGGNAAGMSAASKIAREKKNYTVCVFDSSEFLSYGACGLPYLFSKEVKDEAKLFALTEKDISERGIKIEKNEMAVELLPGRKRIVFKNIKSGKLREESYDFLVIATGSVAKKINILNFEGENVFCLHNLSDALKIKNYIGTNKVYSVVIVGAGYIGLEMAECLSKWGMNVLLVSNKRIFLKKLTEEFSLILAEHFSEKGVKIFTETSISGVKKEKDKVIAIETNKGELSGDIFIYGVGVSPNTDFLKNSGLSFANNEAIKVDEKCRTNLHNVYACGDCCAVKNILTGKYVYIPLGTTANKMGRVAGANIVGKREEFRGVLGTSIIRVFDYEVGMTGLTLQEAKKEGFSAREVTIKSHSKPHYFDNFGVVYVNLVGDNSGRILGGQIIGTEGVKGRIDTLTAIISGKINVEEAKYLDFAYAPPFGPVWDPLLVALYNFQKDPTI